MKISERFGKTKVERVAVGLVLLGATLSALSFVLQRNGSISSEASSYIMLGVTILQLATCVPLYVQWKQIKTQEKARLEKEADDAARAEKYLSGGMTTWK